MADYDRLRMDMAVPWGVVSEDGHMIEDPELASARAPTHANILVLSPESVRDALNSGTVIDRKAAIGLVDPTKTLVNHQKTLARGTCVLCEQYAVLGWWCATREDFVCCACHDRHDEDEDLDDAGATCPTDGYYVSDKEAAEAAAKKVDAPSAETHMLVKLAGEGRLVRHCVRGVQFFADPMNDAVQGVGAHLWFAARALIDYVAPNGQGAVASGARVCELGAGCGGVGLALHTLSQCAVTLTDLPHILPLLRFNAAHVACASPAREPARVAPLRWGDDHDLAALSPERFDVILGADIAYEPEQHLPLLLTMETLAASSSSSSSSASSSASSCSAASSSSSSPEGGSSP